MTENFGETPMDNEEICEEISDPSSEKQINSSETRDAIFDDGEEEAILHQACQDPHRFPSAQ